MDDATYTFVQTSRERKNLSRSARHRVSGAKSRKCTLPSDALTAAQRRRLNSEVKTYTLNEQHTLKELRTWPVEYQREYISKILRDMNPLTKELAELLGASSAHTSYYLGTLGLSNAARKRTKTPEQQRAWDALMGNTEEPVIVEEPPQPAQESVSAPTPRSPITYDSMSLTFTGTAQDLIGVLTTGPVHLTGADTYTFTITVIRKEG